MANTYCRTSIDDRSKMIVRNIVGKCFVGDSYFDVCRLVVRSIKGGHKAFRTLPKKLRRNILKTAIDCHKDNRRLYSYVMAGYSA